MNIKYIPSFTEDIEGQVRFFADDLGFEGYNKKNVLISLDCMVMQTANADTFMQIVKDHEYGNRKFSIVVSTDDRLSNFNDLKLAGIQFNNEPQYTPDGLRAVFTDPSCDRYLLIEKRNYNNLSENGILENTEE